MIKNRSTLLKPFDDNAQKLAFSKLLDGVDSCVKRHAYFFSGFVDPVCTEKFIRRLALAQGVRVNFMAFGGFLNAERKMIGVSPEWEELTEDVFPLDAVNITYNTKFSKTLTHRDFLGAVLGLGLERHCIGDVLLTENGAVVIVSRQMAGYVSTNIDKVGSVYVQATQKAVKEISFTQCACIEKTVTLSSLRVDNIISACFKISRKEAAVLVAHKKVFINWVELSSASKQVKEKDIVTVRGLGRVEICGAPRLTRKGKLMQNVILFH